MEDLSKIYKKTTRAYNSLSPHYESCLEIVAYCQQKLAKSAKFFVYGEFAGDPKVPYSVFAANDRISRAVRGDLLINSREEFLTKSKQLVDLTKDKERVCAEADYLCAAQVIYTAIMPFACCFDLWNPDARKTPGTFFEVYMAGLLQNVFPDAVFSKHISLTKIVAAGKIIPEQVPVTSGEEDIQIEDDEEDSSVSTDIVVAVAGKPGGIVLPLKITTRERIVQPFAHQRILDAAIGPGVYKSLIVCISETRLDKKKKIEQICVPGTVKLFQKHLAPIDGMYYCDLPQRYAKEDLTKMVRVQPIGYLFSDLRSMLESIKAQARADSSPLMTPPASGTVQAVVERRSVPS